MDRNQVPRLSCRQAAADRGPRVRGGDGHRAGLFDRARDPPVPGVLGGEPQVIRRRLLWDPRQAEQVPRRPTIGRGLLAPPAKETAAVLYGLLQRNYLLREP